jgi:hypothetical protein
MIGTAHELNIDGVLISPFVGYATAALVLVLILRTFFRLVRFERAFANPPLAVIAIYICILGLVISLL